METQNLLKQARPAAEPFARTLTDRFQEIRLSLEALAASPDLLDSWDRGDRPAMTGHLREASALRSRAASFAIYDGNGVLRAWSPNSLHPKSDAAAQAWFKATLETGKSYVSGVEPMVDGTMAVIVSVPLRGKRSSGVLATAYPVSAIQYWLENIPPSVTKWTSVIDQNGAIVTGAKLHSVQPNEVRNLEEVRKLIHGDEGVEFIRRDRERFLVGRLPIPSLGWGVLIELPSQEIDKTVWQFERPIAFLGLLFTALALIFAAFTMSLYGRLRESREQARQILTASTDAFVAMDHTGRVAEWNPRAEVLFGWARTEVAGRLLAETIIPERYRESHLRGLAHFLATGEGPILGKRIELSAVDRYGRELPVELSISHMLQRGKSFFSAFVHDISERKHAEKEIHQLNLQLHERIEDLEAKNKDLEAFSYSVSHDVRAPLRHIHGYSKLLVEDFGQEMSSGARECVDQIEKSTRQVQQLVEDLLRFSRLGEHGLERRSTDLNKVVAEVVAELKKDPSGQKVEFEIAKLPIVECDRGLISQVFWNLLANAMKFSATRERPLVCVGEIQQEDERVLFVRDNGVGFDMKQAGKLFSVFQRLHRQDEFEGTGVGLATVQRIIQKHGGRIWADSKPGQGASFFFVLPPPATSGDPDRGTPSGRLREAQC